MVCMGINCSFSIWFFNSYITKLNVSYVGTGLDNIDINIATEKKITVTNAPAANVDAVADLAFGFILSLAR